jgi:hypothetical protein
MSWSILPWIVLAMGTIGVGIGGVEWLRGRGGRRALLGVENVALGTGLLLGASHPVWRYTCLAIVLILVTIWLATTLTTLSTWAGRPGATASP